MVYQFSSMYQYNLRPCLQCFDTVVGWLHGHAIWPIEILLQQGCT